MQPDPLPEIPSHHATTLDEFGEVYSALFMPDDGSGNDAVLVHLHTDVIDLWRLAVHHWPELGGTLVALAALLVLVAVLRVRARPERSGAWHCRKCRFELSAHADDAGTPRTDAPCPECGRALSSPRALIRGRSPRRRLVLPASIAAVLAAAYAACWIGSVGRTNAATDMLFLPSERLADIALEHDLTRLKPFVSLADRFVTLDFRTGDPITVGKPIRHISWTAPRVSPDGQTVFRAFGTRPSEARAQQIDLRTSTIKHEAALPFDDPMAVSAIRGDSPILAVIDDGSSVLVTGRTGDRHQVLRWTLSSGEVTELVSAPAAEHRGPWQTTANRFNHPTDIATLPSFSEMHNSGTATVNVFHLDAPESPAATYTFSAEVTIGKLAISSTSGPVIFPDGRRFAVASGNVQAALVGIDLETGNAGELRPPPAGEGLSRITSAADSVAVSADGSTLIVGTVATGDVIAATRSTDQRRWTALLTHEPDLIGLASMLSHNGTSAITIGFFDNPNPATGIGGRPRRYINKLVFHDLSAITTPTPEIPDDTP